MRLGWRGLSEFFPQIRHRNAFTEIAWEDAEQGLGMVMSTLASEKNRELLQGIILSATCFSSTNSDISGCCFTGVERTTSWKSQILIPSKKPEFRYGKN